MEHDQPTSAPAGDAPSASPISPTCSCGSPSCEALAIRVDRVATAMWGVRSDVSKTERFRRMAQLAIAEADAHRPVEGSQSVTVAELDAERLDAAAFALFQVVMAQGKRFGGPPAPADDATLWAAMHPQERAYIAGGAHDILHAADAVVAKRRLVRACCEGCDGYTPAKSAGVGLAEREGTTKVLVSLDTEAVGLTVEQARSVAAALLQAAQDADVRNARPRA